MALFVSDAKIRHLNLCHLLYTKVDEKMQQHLDEFDDDAGHGSEGERADDDREFRQIDLIEARQERKRKIHTCKAVGALL